MDFKINHLDQELDRCLAYVDFISNNEIIHSRTYAFTNDLSEIYPKIKVDLDKFTNIKTLFDNSNTKILDNKFNLKNEIDKVTQDQVDA